MSTEQFFINVSAQKVGSVNASYEAYVKLGTAAPKPLQAGCDYKVVFDRKNERTLENIFASFKHSDSLILDFELWRGLWGDRLYVSNIRK